MSGIGARLRWYKNRLAAMRPAEIAWRAAEAARRLSDRFAAQNLITPPRDYGALPHLPGLRENLQKWQVPESLLHQWRQDADRAQSGMLSFFGQNWPACPTSDRWHLDPRANAMWPRDRFCFAIDYRHAPGKDIKFTWELNRLHYLQPVAALAFKSKDQALAQFCLSQIENWIDHNPPFLGVNWNSGIELALRVISVLTVTTLAGEYLSRATRSKIWASLHTHARWIARYPSRYSSANNHRAAEALGLFAIGALCPHFPEAAVWKKTGWDILCEMAQRLIMPDGAGAEQSTAYSASTLETLLLGLTIAQATDTPVPAFYLHRLTQGAACLRWLMDSGGGVPQIGDDDNACVIGLYHDDDRYAASVTGCIAALTNRADLTPPGLQPHLRQALFGFAPPPDFAPTSARTFAQGGLSIGRHKTSQGDIMLAFDHGPLGYLSIAAHGHADALSLWLHIDDQPVFVDAGTHLYHAAGDQRRHFRGTPAHNTLTISDTDSSLMSGAFNWSHKAQARLCNSAIDGNSWQAEAEHDGYLEKFGAIHHRRLTVSPASGAAIEDWLSASTSLPVAICFLLHPSLTARREGGDIMILKGERLLLRLRHESALETVIAPPGSPGGGFYAPRFGVKQAATRLIFRGSLPPGGKAVTHLFWAS